MDSSITCPPWPLASLVHLASFPKIAFIRICASLNKLRVYNLRSLKSMSGLKEVKEYHMGSYSGKRARGSGYGAAKRSRWGPKLPPSALAVYRRLQVGRRGAEKHATDVASGDLRFDTNSTVGNTMEHLNLIVRDTSNTGRIGKNIVMTGVAIRGGIYAPSTMGATRLHIAMLLIYVRNYNQLAALPPWADILAAQNSNALTNRDNASKFKILRRWDYVSSLTDNHSINVVDEYVKFPRGLVTEWISGNADGTAPGIEKGCLILGTVGEAVYDANTTPVFNGNSRVYFKDA